MKIKRLFALFIDYVIIFFVIYIPTSFLTALNLNTIINIIISILVIIIFYLIFINKDTIVGYTSIGKKIMNLAIYDKNNNIIKDKELLRKRNINSFWMFPAYLFMILNNNKSKGDYKYNTKIDVVKKI